MGVHIIPAAATQEIFETVHRATDMGTTGGKIDGAGDLATAQLLVPQDFSSITSIEAEFNCIETAASQHFDFTTLWGAYNGGEAWNVHTETEAGRDIGATVATENLAHDISDLVDVAALAAGDILVVHVAYSAVVVDSNASFRGIRLKYT